MSPLGPWGEPRGTRHGGVSAVTAPRRGLGTLRVLPGPGAARTRAGCCSPGNKAVFPPLLLRARCSLGPKPVPREEGHAVPANLLPGPPAPLERLLELLCRDARFGQTQQAGGSGVVGLLWSVRGSPGKYQGFPPVCSGFGVCFS